jgi:hypothetical protein
MKPQLAFLASLILVALGGGAAQAKDGFEAVHCGADVRSALLGKRMSDEPAAQIEERYVDLGLKDLGGDEISDSLNSTSWRICAKEYVVVSDQRGVVRDVLLFPAHSRAAPQFSGTCEASGRKMSGAMIGVLDNRGAKGTSHYSAQDETLLPATAAWKIDEKTEKFVPLPTAGLSCPRSTIITLDGGP